MLHGNDVAGVVCVANIWPSIARTIYGDHDRWAGSGTDGHPPPQP